jgi:hypothetical protein
MPSQKRKKGAVNTIRLSALSKNESHDFLGKNTVDGHWTIEKNDQLAKAVPTSTSLS